MTKPQLNDDIEITISLPISYWSVTIDWVARFPFEEPRRIIENVNKQIEEKYKEGMETAAVSLPIKDFNALIFSLHTGPYFVVADVITDMFNQGVDRINEVKAKYASENSETENEESPIVEKAKNAAKKAKKAEKAEK